MDCLLGIDIGTTGTKSALFNTEGELIDFEYQSYPIIYPREGWAEQDPEQWWDALVRTVREVVSRKNRAGDVIAMSLSTQGGCLILLDENFHPLCNAVSWLDRRADEVSGLLTEEIGPEELYNTCGWSIINGLNLPTTLWFREKKPGLFNGTRYFASTADYLNYRLTGKFSIDYTNLAMTQFLDLKTRDWSDKALRIAGITRNNVPEIIPSGTIAGRLTKKAAGELGLPKDVILISGAHDQYCASIGAGALNSGDCVLSTGTAWVLTVTSDRLVFNENRTIHPCIHLLENKYGLLTSVSSGGNSLNWFQSTFQPECSYEELSGQAEKADAGSAGLIFIPGIVSGRGGSSFLNIDTAHKSGHFVRSIFEGVALSNKRHLEAFAETGTRIKKLIMIGGGAKSSVWTQIVADVSDIPVVIQERKEASCAGAAILAGVGSGVFNSIEEASERFSVEKCQIKPIEKNAGVYKGIYKEFIRYLECL